MKSKVILFDKRPLGKPAFENFRFVEEEIPAIESGQLLLKTLYVSVDPYLRGRMTEAKSYIPPFELGKPLASVLVAEVVESKQEGFQKGDFVTGSLEWKEFQVSNGKGLRKIEAVDGQLSPHLGVLGMTGLTAYFGLTEIGKPKEGETIVVSGAAGAVGSIVGQIGKILGCRVIGIAGSDEKVDLLKNRFGFDEAINYHTSSDMSAAIAAAAPKGVDVYFDNVGGAISDAVLSHINRFARVPVCGAIASYNNTQPDLGPRVQTVLVKNSVLMQGFIVGNYQEKFPQGIAQLTRWLLERKIVGTETIVEGFDQIPQAFIDLFDGKNNGKMIVKI
ncbi:NADP-dependent oxidoreductase [Pedobacter sp. AW1-32]|uniref:NADP-dependent oxidoreductase n=1 Tax=Pedobacter sp. AW1-32 TaxID=3383026 RepID=UPI003FF09078